MTTYTVPAGRYGDYSTAFIQAYIDQKIAGVVDLAPETLNSLNEIAAAIGDDANFVTTINDAIAAVQADVNANETAAANLVTALETARGLVTDALSGRLNTLETDPTTQSYVDNIQTALDGRLDTLELDPTTQTLLDAEETARENADTALSGRLDTLEADPTTQTLLDSEATTRGNADTALSGRLDVLEADPTTATAVAAVQTDVDANEASRKTYFDWDSNITKVINPVRGTGINVGNNIEMIPAAAGGRVEITGDLVLDASDLTDAADDTAAAAAGVIVGQIYHNSGALRVRLS